MAAGYFAAGKTQERAVFELFVRRLPGNRDFLIAAGLKQAAEYLLNLRFGKDEIAYLQTLPQFSTVNPRFFEYLREFRFTGQLWAMPEGTPFFPGEPIATVIGPLIEAQVVETYLLSTFAFQSLIATKAARVVDAAEGRGVVEFGTRRAHTPEAGVLAARASYIAGCIGTSNVEAGRQFNIPVFGTSAHSWVLAFPDELASFRSLQRLLGERTVYLIDTYNTVEGARKAVSLGGPLLGVRLDSGDLAGLSRQVREILDKAGFHQAKIMATSDLNEYRIAELVAAGAPIDMFGVGTDLATSADAPSLSAVYKLVELDVSGIRRHVAKFSEDKQTLPGAKQVFRYRDHDVIGCAHECVPRNSAGLSPNALLRPVILDGQLAEPLASTADARAHCAIARQKVQPPHRIEYSHELLALAAQQGRG
jgi:nicotinate phosphoribosyltransferase